MTDKLWTPASDTVATSGDNEMIAAPGAGYRTVVGLFMVQNESAVQTTAIVKAGSSESYRKQLDGGADFGRAFQAGREWRLDENTALVLNLDGANSHGYSVESWMEPV